MKQPASSSDVRTELWTSFASLLKSYAAVASLHGASHGVLVLSQTSLHLHCSRNSLKLSYHPTIGWGVWSLYRGTDRHLSAEQPRQMDEGGFEMNVDGSITLDGDRLEMDFAAIQLIAVLTHAASREEIEVPA